jgi:HlyD family secretion protein
MMRLRYSSTLGLLILILALAGCSSGSSDSQEDIRASGFIEGRLYTLSSALGGRIDEVLVTPGDVVGSGDLLINLDSTELEIMRDQAQAAVEAAQAEIANLQDRPTAIEIAEASANVDIATAELDAAEAALDLLNSGYEPLDPPQAEVNAAESAIVVAGAGLTLAQARSAQVEAGPHDEEVKILEASLAEAQAQLELVDRQLLELTLTAPQDGVIQQVLNSVGEVVTPGSPIAYLMDPDYLTLTLYVPVTDIAKVQLGGTVEISSDSYPDEVFSGSVTRIADEAQFTPATVLTEEERVKLVFAVEILVDDPSGKLKPGMPVDAVIKP